MAPGAYLPTTDLWGSLTERVSRLPSPALVLVDERVLALHPAVEQTLRAASPRLLLPLTAGEGAKSLDMLERVLARAVEMPRSGTVVCIGGGTLGDLGTVAAHVLKRGLRLVHVPTTLLAAVDSSVGGKGAVHVRAGSELVKNAVGVFHYAAESWLCPELFTTLTEHQLREGRIEAWKMVTCLDATRFRAYRSQPPDLARLIGDARAIKGDVCRRDPYEQRGIREVLNYGHTFGHVLESLSGFGISHGDAVGMGILCALDIGRELALTPASVAAEVEATFASEVGAPGRASLARALIGVSEERVASLLSTDKKGGSQGELRMVLSTRIGGTTIAVVPRAVWRGLLPKWQAGEATG